MKANAPEGIYLLPDDRNPNGLSICWYDAPYRTGAIEYIRADAFIEKAWNWIEDNMLSLNQQDKSRLYFEQFVNYMKGE